MCDIKPLTWSISINRKIKPELKVLLTNMNMQTEGIYIDESHDIKSIYQTIEKPEVSMPPFSI